MRSHLALLLALGLAACGGTQDGSNTPDESGDLAVQGGSGRASGEIPPGLDNTRWRWVEAHCTEGPLDLLARGYASTLEVHETEGGLQLVRDEQFATEQCQHTVIMNARAGRPDWRMDEFTRVAVRPPRSASAPRIRPSPARSGWTAIASRC